MRNMAAGALCLLGAGWLSACVPSAGSQQPGPLATMPSAIPGPGDSLVCALMVDAGFTAAEPMAGRGGLALRRQRQGDASCEAGAAPDQRDAGQWIVREAPAAPELQGGGAEGPRLTIALQPCTEGHGCKALGRP